MDIGAKQFQALARFSVVRLQESNRGNFGSDIMGQYYHIDCAIMATGTIRGDQIYPPRGIKDERNDDILSLRGPCGRFEGHRKSYLGCVGKRRIIFIQR